MAVNGYLFHENRFYFLENKTVYRNPLECDHADTSDERQSNECCKRTPGGAKFCGVCVKPNQCGRHIGGKLWNISF